MSLNYDAIYCTMSKSKMVIAAGIPRSKEQSMTLNEVGKMAGVSRMTVSRYFNGGYVSEASREKIEKIVQETGFRPSAQAKALKTRKTETIGVIISSLDSALLVNIINQLHAGMEEIGYQILIMRYLQSKQLLIQQIRNLIAKGVDGLIVSLVVADDEIRRELEVCPVPVVMFGPMGLEGICSVVHDDSSGLALIVDELAGRGYKDIGCMAPDFGSQMTKLRVGAVRAEMEKLGLNVCDEWFLECKDDRMTHYEMGKYLAEKVIHMPVMPTAMIAVSDQIAIGALAAFSKSGVSIPGSLAVTGYGNIDVGNFLNPTLTTVDMNLQEIVDKISQLLLEQINKNQKIDRKMEVSPLLIIRESI